MRKLCGRFSQKSDPATWVELFSGELGIIDIATGEVIENYNVAPTDPLVMLARSKTGELTLRSANWGLVPSWSKDTKGAARLINARAETILDKPAFRTAFGKRRCIIPVDNFYDWAKRGDSKQPYGIWASGMNPLPLAGLYEFWKADSESDWHVSATILTCDPNAEMSKIHHRMPVVLDKQDWRLWLDSEATTDDLLPLLHPYDDGSLELHRVSTAINSSKIKDSSGLKLEA